MTMVMYEDVDEEATMLIKKRKKLMTFALGDFHKYEGVAAVEDVDLRSYVY